MRGIPRAGGSLNAPRPETHPGLKRTLVIAPAARGDQDVKIAASRGDGSVWGFTDIALFLFSTNT